MQFDASASIDLGYDEEISEEGPQNVTQDPSVESWKNALLNFVDIDVNVEEQENAKIVPTYTMRIFDTCDACDEELPSPIMVLQPEGGELPHIVHPDCHD